MQRLELTARQRADLEAAAAAEPRVGRWKRYRAILLLQEWTPEAVAAALGCGRSSVYGWAAAWRGQGLAGLRERPRGGRPRRLGGAGEATLEALLAANPQQQGQLATGWTVPLLRAELGRAGHRVGEHTVRRQLHRSGWRWKRPKYVLGRPDPAYAEKNGRSPSGRRTS
jgi:transposase